MPDMYFPIKWINLSHLSIIEVTDLSDKSFSNFPDHFQLKIIAICHTFNIMDFVDILVLLQLFSWWKGWLLRIVFFEIDYFVWLKHIQGFCTAEFMLRYQYVNAILISLAIVSTNSCYWKNRVMKSFSCCFYISFFLLCLVFFCFFFGFRRVFQVNCKKFFVKMLVFYLPIHNSFVKGSLFTTSWSWILEDKQYVTFNVCSQSFICNNWFIFIFF